MYLAEAEEIFDHWQDSPPTYQAVGLIARMLGWEPKSREDDGVPPDVPGISEAIAAAVGKMAGVPPPVVSLDAMREQNRQKIIAIAERNMAKAAQAG